MGEASEFSSKPNSIEESSVASSQEEAALGEVEALRHDVEAGLRFLHLLSMQMKKVLFDSASQSAALIEELTTSFGLDHARLDARQNDCREKEYQRIREHAYVQIDDTYDKYALKELPEIDCVSRIHLCRARCCSFTF